MDNIQATARTIQTLLPRCGENLDTLAAQCMQVMIAGGKLFTAGDGRCNVLAMYATSLFNEGWDVLEGKVRLESQCLSAQASTVARYTMTEGYERMYAARLERIGSPDDLALFFCLDGTSKNILSVWNSTWHGRPYVITGDFESTLNNDDRLSILQLPAASISGYIECCMVALHALHRKIAAGLQRTDMRKTTKERH